MARFPQPDAAWYDDEAEAQAEAVIEVVRAIRNIRSERRVEPARFVEAHVQAPRLRAALEASRPLIATLARAEPLHIVGEEARLPSENVATAVLAEGRVALPLAGLFDLEAERSRLSRQISELEGEVGRLESRLADERFRTRAPAAVVRQEEERLASARSRLEGLRARLSELGKARCLESANRPLRDCRVDLRHEPHGLIDGDDHLLVVLEVLVGERAARDDPSATSGRAGSRRPRTPTRSLRYALEVLSANARRWVALVDVDAARPRPACRPPGLARPARRSGGSRGPRCSGRRTG